MVSKTIKCILVQGFIAKTLASYGPPVAHYYPAPAPYPAPAQYPAPTPYPAPNPYPATPPYPVPPTSHTPPAHPAYQPQYNYPPYQHYESKPKPKAVVALPPPITTEVAKPPVTKSPTEKSKSSKIDSKVLNNLAIALQLLIVSNLVNNRESNDDISELLATNPFESLTAAVSAYKHPTATETPYLPSSQSQPYYTYASYEKEPVSYQYPSTVPSANFLGSSGFVDTNVLGSMPFSSYGIPKAAPNPRTSLTLISPYDAIGPNSPFSDPILSSSYGNLISTKEDFQSPYAAILSADSNRDYKDLFSI